MSFSLSHKTGFPNSSCCTNFNFKPPSILPAALKYTGTYPTKICLVYETPNFILPVTVNSENFNILQSNTKEPVIENPKSNLNEPFKNLFS